MLISIVYVITSLHIIYYKKYILHYFQSLPAIFKYYQAFLITVVAFQVLNFHRNLSNLRNLYELVHFIKLFMSTFFPWQTFQIYHQYFINLPRRGHVCCYTILSQYVIKSIFIFIIKLFTHIYNIYVGCSWPKVRVDRIYIFRGNPWVHCGIHSRNRSFFKNSIFQNSTGNAGHFS